MKSLLWIAILTFANTLTAMESFSDANYSGSGRWKDNHGNAGNYQLSTQVSNNVVDSIYEFDGQQKQWSFQANFSSNGFFAVHSEGKKVGRGYCYSLQCHYSVRMGDSKIEETLTFVDGKLFRLGSKKNKGTRVVWEEKLQ